MNARNQPVKWKHANQAHAETRDADFSREQKRPPAPAPAGAEKIAEKTTPPAAASVSPKNTAAAVAVTAPVARAAAGPAPGEVRSVKGLLGPVVWDGTLVVWSMPRTNTRLVIGYKKGTDPENPLNLFNVLVRENFNFLAGMCIPGPQGKITAVNHNTYELQGACPRWRGRW